MFNDRWSALGTHAVYGPFAALTGASMGAQAIGGLVGAAGTLAGGSYAKKAGVMQQQGANFQATQLEQNAAQSIAAGQRNMMDTQETTRLLASSANAAAGASGVDPGVGSPATVQGEIAGRGEFNALMDMFNGQSAATGLRNQAAGVRYTGQIEAAGGDEAEKASKLAALGTIAGSTGGIAKTAGGINWPAYRWGGPN